MEKTRTVRWAAASCGAAIIIALALSNAPRSQFMQTASAAQLDGDDGGCSVSSLRGTYAMQAQGTIVGQIPGFPPPPFPFAEAGIIRFDANGNLSGHSTVNVGGVTFPATFTGSYSVNSDCTGTLTVNLSNGLIAHDATVVVRGGQGFRDVQMDSFGVITRNGERIGD
jgi:hypothetical protein